MTTQTGKFQQAITAVSALSQEEQAMLLAQLQSSLADYLWEKRKEKGWKLARTVAQQLRKQLGATRVLAFGSLISKLMHNPTADVELAAWGIPNNQYMKGLGIALDSSPEILVELVDLKLCSTRELELIEKDGVEV